jgi:glycosyltransferase involved in cell wall biosynthesis
MKSIVITLPAHNEDKILRSSVSTIVAFCDKNLLDFDWRVVISDNGSTDSTPEVGQDLQRLYDRVFYSRIEQKGKGWGIRAGWQTIDCDFYCFMDADLATDLQALPVAIQELNKGNDLVVGSRFLPQSQVHRTLVRWTFSYLYKLASFVLVQCPVNDLPCGFKIIHKRAWGDIEKSIYATDWFFDSELVIIAHRRGFKIKELPIKWNDIREKNDKSKVKVLSLGWRYLVSLLALRKRLNNK